MEKVRERERKRETEGEIEGSLCVCPVKSGM